MDMVSPTNKNARKVFAIVYLTTGSGGLKVIVHSRKN